MTTWRLKIFGKRIVIWAVAGAILGALLGAVLQLASDALSDAPWQIVLIAAVGALLGAVGSLLITAERGDGGEGRRPGT